MYFSLIFRVFSRTPPGDDFWRVQALIYARKCGFGTIWRFRGFPKWILFSSLGLKRSSKTMRQIYQEQPGAQGPPLQRWPPAQNCLTQSFHWFFIDFGMILDGFSMIWKDFRMIFSIFLHTFWRRFPIGNTRSAKNLFAGCYWQTRFVCRLHLTNQICLPAAPYKQDLFAGCVFQTNVVCWRY